ncbi:MAG: DUF1289 domain-containing protein [Pseudomonadales bacterium]
MVLPASPCVRNCCLNDDVCMGCHRHIDEIMAWGRADGPTREQILQRAAERAAQAKAQSDPASDSPS